MDDTELLREYVNAGSERAFTDLVNRHINLVYASARRMTRDAHVAEDVTQAVFIVLAKKASCVRHGGMLPAWLLTAARYASKNAMIKSNRRRKHEMAAAMSSDTTFASDTGEPISDDGPISPTLDAALAGLGTSDRSAVAMRYLQGKSIREISTAMGISQHAAQKRVMRALARLREYFARRGIVFDGMELDAGLSRQFECVAPAALAPAVAAKALWTKSMGTAATAAGVTGAGTGSGAAGAIANVVLRSIGWATTLKTAAACGIAFAVLGASAVAVQSARQTPSTQAAAPATTAPVPHVVKLPPAKPFTTLVLSAESIWQPYVPSTQPGTEVVAIQNESLVPVKGKKVVAFTGLDSETHHGSSAAAKISMDIPGASVMMSREFDAAPYLGKRIRLSGFVKSQNVERQCGLFLNIYRADGAMLAQDDLGGRWPAATADWTRHDIVSDVSPEAAKIVVQVFLRGTGTVWGDGLELAVVDKSVPINDDHRWRGWTRTPAKYQTTLDKKVLHNGRPTICMIGADANDPVNDWIAYDHTELDIRPFLGKKVRLSVMIKSEDVSYAGPVIRGVGVENTTVARDEFNGRRPVRGTSDWTRYSTTLTCPKDAIDLSFGVWMNGRGKIWFDDLRFEIVN